MALVEPNKVGHMTIASMESLAIPRVQEIVFLADFRCARCQDRVAQVMSKMNGEAQSIVFNVLEKKVTLTFINPKPRRVLLSEGQSAPPISKIALIMRQLLPFCT